MAADWYYVANQKQVGPVELQSLRDMLNAGSLTSADMVYGPGLSEWTRAGLIAALSHADNAGIPVAQTSAQVAGDVGMLAYRSMETGNAGLSHTATDFLRQTKPWARFIAIMMFIFAGLMVVGGIFMMLGGMIMGGRMRQAVPAGVGLIYLALGALYLAPAIFLNRFASGILNLLRTGRMSDLEQALGAQKSFWKFMGIMMIIIIVIYVVVFAVMIVVALH